MELFFTPITIILATCAGFAVGFVWYSPFLFMNAWLKGEGLTKSSIPKRSSEYMLRVQVYSLIAHGAIASVLALVYDLLSVATLKVAVSLALLLALGFVVTTRFVDMVYTTKGVHYDMQSQVKFLVSSGYYLLTFLVMGAVLFLSSTW